MYRNRIRSCRRSSLRLAIAGALVTMLLLPPVASAQRPQFRSRVELIQFQVRVKDASGNFVPGLEASDFQLRVNGSERPITTVYEVNVGAGPVPADQPPAAWRQWVLFFDAAFNTPRGMVGAQEAAREFVTNQVGERDLIGVATFSVVTGARMVVPLTRDRRQVLQAIGGLGLNAATRNVDRAGFLAMSMAEGMDMEVTEDTSAGAAAAQQAVEEAIRQVGNLEVEQYASVAAQYTQQVGANVADLLRTIRGRKHVIYFSQGFADSVLSGQSLDALASTTDEIQQDAGLAIATSSGEDRFGSAEVRSALDETLASFRSSDAVIHIVDPSGLGGGRDRTNIGQLQTGAGDFAARGGTRSALTSLASATGGEMHWETNDLAGAMAEIEANNRAFYVIAFPREGSDDDLLELDISVGTAGATVEAPSELAAPPDYTDMNELERQMQLAEFITKDIEETDLVFDVAAAGFYGDGTRNRLPVVIEVPWEQLTELADSGEDDRVELEIYSYALDEENRMVDLSNGEVNLNVEAMRGGRAAGLPFRYYDLLWANPGTRRVRVVLRDKELGRISSFTSAPATIPEHASGDVVISGPIGIDWDHRGLIMLGFNEQTPPAHKEGGPVAFPFRVGEEVITPAAALSGPPGSQHHAFFVAHNLGRNAEGQPQAAVGLALTSPMGEMLPVGNQQMLMRYHDEATNGTAMVVTGTLPPDLAPGQYELVILLEDQVKGARLTASVPVWVTG